MTDKVKPTSLKSSEGPDIGNDRFNGLPLYETGIVINQSILVAHSTTEVIITLQ